MSALFTALVESETKESLALMVCELRERISRGLLPEDDNDELWVNLSDAADRLDMPIERVYEVMKAVVASISQGGKSGKKDPTG